MTRMFDVTFRVAGERTVPHYANTADDALKEVTRWTWDHLVVSDDIDVVVYDLNRWCKIKIANIADKGELPPPRPSLYAPPVVEALRRILNHYGLEALRTYDGSRDHRYRDVCTLTKALGGDMPEPSPDELDIARGYKTGEVAASKHSNMPLGELVGQMLGIRVKLANLMDDDEASLALRSEYSRLLRELSLRDPDVATAERMRQVGGGERDERGS